ncbi:unnamed protein product [Zymoseptoria tritici ST99CH_3D1]|uniref:Granulins domain-containing protein n=1 Tax=Zymoseptoria tritici (strain ST99CH_3D7) TaxID=1276538 RepID=A0A1X7RYG3_ZYMT9|nr:unnamed protein product [Zymoseptoria tritici ST99CH_3D7]SMR57675.1 unnamed protein product [Zymoseptoria tritici ST99CH_3D1]
MKVLTYTLLTIAAAAIGTCYRHETIGCIHDREYCQSGAHCCTPKYQCLSNECQLTCEDGGVWCPPKTGTCCDIPGYGPSCDPLCE